jgi:hypothetical protein
VRTLARDLVGDLVTMGITQPWRWRLWAAALLLVAWRLAGFALHPGPGTFAALLLHPLPLLFAARLAHGWYRHKAWRARYRKRTTLITL